jgi:DNA-binding transcriptional MerR regulator
MEKQLAGDSMSRSARGVYGISVASELSGIGPQTLRLYERWGLLTPSRTDGGTRRYSDDDLDRLKQITELVDQGVNLAGIARILDLESRNSRLEFDNTQLQLDNAKLKADQRSKKTVVCRKQGGGVPTMTDAEGVVLPDETPEADAVEQRLVADLGDETGLDAAQMKDARDRDANEADLVDQATVVPMPEDQLHD